VQKTLLFIITAIAEISGCYFVYLWYRLGRTAWWLVPATMSLAAFAWMLTLHPQASGRIYAAYGGIYIVTSLVWLWRVDGIKPDHWDLIGGAFCLAGSLIIYFCPRG
jgi:small multidrug resistance family-3 protein